MNERKFFMQILRSSIKSERGQSLILAMMVMFLLVFIGGVFVSMIARNISRSQRSGQSVTADYLAEAGIRYANDQLTYSPDGADWRPVPQYPEVVRALASVTPNPESLPADQKPSENDPDRFWLMQGFSRFTYGQGRFLLRVSYNPTPSDPLSKYLKIESIGRVGIVDPNDPTTLAGRQPQRQRKEIVAYKALGITDYAAFVTNKDRRSGEFSLGMPGFITSWGEDATKGAPIRVNGDLLWHGTNYVWLNPNRGDSVQVAGDIRHAVLGTGVGENENTTRVLVNNALTLESSDPNFVTNPSDGSAEIGNYRDGRSEGDYGGLPRNVTRLDPPLLDAMRASGGVSRYRDLTRNSGEWRWNNNRDAWYNTGYYGWGEGVYINNSSDVQEESSMYTLRGNWTEPGSRHWNGPYYAPPGMSIILTPYDLDNADGDNDATTGPDMILVHDAARGQTAYNWYDEDGNLVQPQGERMIMPYPANGIIFAEGNIRIKGTLPPGQKLTVVSGATIYVEGSILKYPFDSAGNPIPPGTSRDSAIALLAMDNVCVNTTQFFGPSREVLMAGSGGDHFDIGMQNSFWFSFAFGMDANQYVDTSGSRAPLNLFLRHTSDPDQGPSYMNMLVNYPPTAAELGADSHYSLYKFSNMGSSWDYNYPLADVSRNPMGSSVQKYPNWEHAAFRLDVNPFGGSYNFWSAPGVYNTIGFQLDQSFGAGLGIQDYYLSRAAVVPCDINIEALLYAQNGTFFVIPGQWFNPNPADTLRNYQVNGFRPMGVDDRWPFYGEPLDVKITVYGAVSQNTPASIGDVSAWMEKWGWIPPIHGISSNNSDRTVGYRVQLDPAAGDEENVAQRGLTIVYDGQLSCPRIDPMNPAAAPLRRDTYGRILPVVPKLPVSSQMLYFGEPV